MKLLTFNPSGKTCRESCGCKDETSVNYANISQVKDSSEVTQRRKFDELLKQRLQDMPDDKSLSQSPSLSYYGSQKDDLVDHDYKFFGTN